MDFRKVSINLLVILFVLTASAGVSTYPWGSDGAAIEKYTPSGQELAGWAQTGFALIDFAPDGEHPNRWGAFYKGRGLPRPSFSRVGEGERMFP